MKLAPYQAPGKQPADVMESESLLQKGNSRVPLVVQYTFSVCTVLSLVMGVAAAEGSNDNAPSRSDEKCSADRANFMAQNLSLLRPYCDGCLEDGDGTMTLNCGLSCGACDENNENCHSFSSSTVYGMNEDNQTTPLTTSDCLTVWMNRVRAARSIMPPTV